ncbi:DMT family transporter [Actinocrinis puniceicyclus]|uniref:DMT family transporter n=1 Tax=Actinocrinis puniceicyclus TaxID=977794 RepID=A0A8J8BCC4_9ACTN|nr:DMT family transporter [Actinocrinis puniceicyclus]MBS2963385.1 DMT family transporter [Actinocrinis puniceicyclus]
MICVLFAVLTALSNASASVLQRRAASEAPADGAFRLSLFAYLVRRRIWLAGIGMVAAAALFQATALATGPVALVQPIFIIELPLALLIAGLLFRVSLPPRTWVAVAAVTAGLAVALAAAAPSGGVDRASNQLWVLALIATGGFEAVLLVSAVRAHGEPRAALLGLAAACGYALTAALMKQAMASLADGPGAFFTTWQLYATAAAGVGSLFLLQNALQAGTLVASQPMLTIGDALISACYGGLLFAEDIRFGWWLAAQVLGLIAIAAGYIELARSPLASGQGVAPAEAEAGGESADRLERTTAS